MSDLRVKDLRKTFGKRRDIVAVDDVSFEAAPGEMLVLVGPSGCGKTTTLRCLAGLETPDAGIVEFGDQAVFDSHRRVSVPIYRRDIGLVFQNYALWPHMTAWENIAFPLKSRWASRADQRSKIEAIAEVVDLDLHLLDKRPAQLSGGQQQRVALARALIAEPKVVMFDEPLSNLDAALREQLRSEIRRLHDKVQFTGVYVTHDLSEAMLLGDRVAAMADGAIVQLGRPDELFEHPATQRIARLMGYRQLCVLRSRSGRWVATDCDFRGPVGDHPVAGESYELFVRPDRISITHADSPAVAEDEIRIKGGEVCGVGYLGGEQELLVDFGGRRLRLITSMDQTFTGGSTVDLSVRLADARFFQADAAGITTIEETNHDHEDR